MTLREKINEQFNTSLKSKNKTSVSTFRLILAAIKERDIANRTGGKKEEIKVLFLFFWATLNCWFIFSRNDMILKVIIYFTPQILSKEKVYLDEIKSFSYVVQNQVL